MCGYANRELDFSMWVLGIELQVPRPGNKWLYIMSQLTSPDVLILKQKSR